MRDFKNIDRIFQENLKDFEVFPPNKSWDEIEKRLGTTPQKKRLPAWLKLASVAAILALFFTVGAIYFIPKNNLNFQLTQDNKQTETNNKKDSTQITTTEEESNVQQKAKNNKITTSKEVNFTTVSTTETAKIKDNVDKNITESSKTILKKDLLTDSKNLPLENFENAAVKNAKNETKFTVATIFAPIYFSSFGDGSGIDKQFKDNSTSASNAYSYGVKVAYQLNNKFSLQSGVNLINLGYRTNNVYYNPAVAVIGFSNLSAEPILSKSSNIKGNSEIYYDDNVGNLNQVFGYIEIPVEVKYNVAEGKFGVNLVGGFSTLLLNRDEVFIETNSFSQSLGSSNNLRDINFSGNIGIDVDYSIKKNLFINISPMFKVQTNTFSKNSGSFQPYYIGVYTGLNYKF